MGLIMAVQHDKMLENPNVTQEQVDQTMSLMEKMQNPMLGSAAWVALSSVFGLIWSLIGGLVMRSNS